MLDKILKISLPVTVIIIIVQAFKPDGIFSILNSWGMVLICITVYSIGWLISSFVYNRSDSEYSLARHIGLAAVVAVPIVAIVFTPSYLYPYIVGKAFVFRFLACISGLSLIYLTFTSDKYKIKLTPFVVGSFIFTVVMGLATIFSIDPSRSFWSNYERMEGYINLLSLFALALSATTLRLKELEWMKVVRAHIWVSSIISSLAVLQYAIGSLGIKAAASLPILSLCITQGAGCRADATLGNSIYLGVYAALTFWIIIYAIFVKKVKGNLFPLLAAINLLAVYFSSTRGVWVGMLLGLAVLNITKYWFDGNKKAVAGTILSGILFVTLFAGFVTYANKNGIAQNVAIVTRFNSINTLFARWNIWKTAVVSWEQKPVLGWGQENFIHAFNLNYNPAMYGQETYFDHPHNTYLGWLVFGGLLGFLAFLFMLFTSIYGIIKSNLEEEKNNDLIIPVLLALFTTYFVHIFFVFDNLTSSLLFVMVSVYFGSAYSYGTLNLPTLSGNAKKALGIITTLICLYFIYASIYKPSFANTTVIEAMTYQQRSTTQDPAELLANIKGLYEKSISIDTFGNYEIREFYLQKSLEYIGLLAQVKDDRVKTSIFDFANSALNQFRLQIDRNPFDHRAKFMLGLYYLNIRNYDLAIATLLQALDVAPNKQIALIYLAKAYLLKGDIANASNYYERAISITPKNIGGYNQIRIEYIQIMMLANQDEKALATIKELIPTVNREEFNSLVSQMMQVYTQRKDLKGIIKLLGDAIALDPVNQNFVLWLAQANVAAGDYNAAVFTINKLSTSNPEVVAQFNSELQTYLKSQQEKQAAEAPAPKTTKK
jgi:O-antigen ligase/tetratricopeptide (TPR) repeat protein